MSASNPSILPQERNPLSLFRKVKNRPLAWVGVESGSHRALTPEPYFLQALSLERKRAERSGKHFLLMLLAGEQAFQTAEKATEQIGVALAGLIRETDQSGWYRQGRTVGVIFTEVTVARAEATQEVLKAKVGAALRIKLRPEDVKRIQVSFHLFPEASQTGGLLPINVGLSEPQMVEILERADQALNVKAKTALL